MSDPTQLAIPSCERDSTSSGDDLPGKNPLSQGSVLARWRLVPFVPCWGAILCVVGGFRASSAYPPVPPAPPLRCDGQKRLQTPPGGSVVWLRTSALSQWAPGTLLPPPAPPGGLSLPLRLGTGEPPPPPPLGLSHHRGDVRSRALQVQGAGARRPLLGWGGIRASGRSLFGEGRLGAQACFQPCHCCF